MLKFGPKTKSLYMPEKTKDLDSPAKASISNLVVSKAKAPPKPPQLGTRTHPKRKRFRFGYWPGVSPTP